jgi:hypothetical protein
LKIKTSNGGKYLKDVFGKYVDSELEEAHIIPFLFLLGTDI